MVSKPRFSKAVESPRPYKSHRYDVFGLKVRRMLTLYGRIPLDTWTLLEADPGVDGYCERPILITDTKPKRVVDFWVRQKNRDELWFLLRPGEQAHEDGNWLPPAFKTWAASQVFHLVFFNPVDLDDRKIFLENWGGIIRYLSTNGKFVRSSLVDQIGEAIQRPKTLRGIEACFPEDDPMLVRTAAFSLLHRGKLRCDELHSTPLSLDSVFVPV